MIRGMLHLWQAHGVQCFLRNTCSVGRRTMLANSARSLDSSSLSHELQQRGAPNEFQILYQRGNGSER